MPSKDFIVRVRGDGLLLEGSGVAESAGRNGDWHARDLGPDAFLVEPLADSPKDAAKAGVASYSIDMFAEFLLSLHESAWSGLITVTTSLAQRRIYFRHGAFVFATSTLVDDRLGEVIYRNGTIDLDSWIAAAAQVDRDTKLGQALIRSGRFTSQDLWHALQLQAHDILRSVLMEPEVFLRITPDAFAPTEVTFQRSTRDILEECHCHGVVFRDILSRWPEDSYVTAPDNAPPVQSGTFVGDLLDLIVANQTVGAIVEASRISREHTLRAILAAYRAGFCAIELVSSAIDQTFLAEHMGQLRVRLIEQKQLAQRIRTAFDDHGAPLPIAEFRAFAADLNRDCGDVFFLDGTGALAAESVRAVCAQARVRKSRTLTFERQLQSLIGFMNLVAADVMQAHKTGGAKRPVRTAV